MLQVQVSHPPDHLEQVREAPLPALDLDEPLHGLLGGVVGDEDVKFEEVSRIGLDDLLLHEVARRLEQGGDVVLKLLASPGDVRQLHDLLAHQQPSPCRATISAAIRGGDVFPEVSPSERRPPWARAGRPFRENHLQHPCAWRLIHRPPRNPRVPRTVLAKWPSSGHGSRDSATGSETPQLLWDLAGHVSRRCCDP